MVLKVGDEVVFIKEGMSYEWPSLSGYHIIAAINEGPRDEQFVRLENVDEKFYRITRLKLTKSREFDSQLMELISD